MLKEFRKMFNKSNLISSNIGRNLVIFFLEELRGSLLKKIKNEVPLKVEDAIILIELTTAYLFCFKVVTQTNTFSLSRQRIDSIYLEIKLSLVRWNINNYSMEKTVDEVLKEIQEKVDLLLLIYSITERGNLKALFRVMQKIYQNIYGMEIILGDQEQCILYMLLKSITNIQDYLTDLSMNVED